MHPVGFEPTHLSIVGLKPTPLDHSGTDAFTLFPPVAYTFLSFKNFMEMRGIDPLAPRMRSECSTIWATSPFCLLFSSFILPIFWQKMHPVGFEPTHLSIAVLETAPLDHSGTNASLYYTYNSRDVPLPPDFFCKNASGGVRTHASLDSRAYIGPLDHSGTNASCYYSLRFYPTILTSITIPTYPFYPFDTLTSFLLKLYLHILLHPI